MTLNERVLDPWVYPLPAPLEGHLEDMQFKPWVYGTPPRARPQSHIKASAQKPRSASCMHRLMPCLRRPLRADRLREGLFPLRGPVRPDRRLSRFWTLLRDLTGRPLTGRLLTGPVSGSFTETDDEEAYGKAGALREAPYGEERSSREGPVLTGRATGRQGPYEEGRSLREGPVPYGKGRGPLRVLHREGRRRGLREGRALSGSPLRGGTVLTGRAGPYGKGRGPLRGWVPSQRRTTFNYRKAYRKLRGGTLPELGGNFRLCAVDQKRSFFPKVGPFLDL